MSPEVATAAPTLAPRRPHPRCLIVVRAGDDSLHLQWLAGPSRDFDLFVSYYGASDATARRYAASADRFERRPGPKWPGIAALLEAHADLGTYDAVWFPDDDLAANGAQIDRMFAFFLAFGLCLAQPALTRDSYFTWSTLRQKAGCHLRFTRFVEVMAPIFSRAALAACAPSFTQSRSGWGLDWAWPLLCDRAGLAGIAVIDATPVRHTRPVGRGDLYRGCPDLDPEADAARVIASYGLKEVRALAKYSVEREVRDVPLPPRTRLLFWLKRLNGRRKQLLSA